MDSFPDIIGFYGALLIPMWVGGLLVIVHLIGIAAFFWLVGFVSGVDEVTVLFDTLDGLSRGAIFAIGLYFGAMGGLVLSQRSDKS